MKVCPLRLENLTASEHHTSAPRTREELTNGRTCLVAYDHLRPLAHEHIHRLHDAAFSSSTHDTGAFVITYTLRSLHRSCVLRTSSARRVISSTLG
ncbi:uncharacterized protein LAESUDRAFT_729993 [Laetiporus sulphureus 93-53]|uniref:Uncharacterized protein n=1 Tax=Laetiporus sulphureus 93-53 TaxID=1314785 RepID=A0A165CFY7_9APHY|nr:uncharacterized protein LAESUDRAFT_729993 [Laetiporus sulphureus 93-53]KZT02741.1 hypothetical protein LAESUDRAFT_729993 [Laetiporus sulphureus 93-53]